MTALHDYESYDAVGLAELVRRKEVSPLDMVDAAIERIEAHNPQLNAVVYPMFAQARQAAQGELPDGPLRGVPFLVKDLLAMVAGVPISFGTRLLKNWAPPADSELVRRWKAAGLVIAGKTNTSEFGFMPWTEPELFGPTHNPYDPTRTAGGSSGGSGAAVAARLVPVASGGDGGGSIRVPASVNGVFGLKPTRGRTPAGPLYYELWEGCAIEHALTRSVRDSAALLDATAGADIGAPYAAPPQERPFLAEVGRDPGKLRIAFTTQALIGVDDPPPDPECVRGLHATVKLLESLGHEVVEAAPKIDYAELAMAFMTMTSGQAANDIRETAALVGRKPARSDFELSTWVLGQLGRAFTAADYVHATRFLGTAARQAGDFFTQYDVLLTPTLPTPPFVIGALQPSAAERRLLGAVSALRAGKVLTAFDLVRPFALKTFSFIRYLVLFNVTGQPAMSVPLHWTDAGLPVGMHFAGRFGDEATLFRLAGQLEQERPWAGRAPAMVRRPETPAADPAID
ncbi:MAG: amidase [Caldilineaceae bacterium]|nr:amidase [Caldilineaceae bacterium]